MRGLICAWALCAVCGCASDSGTAGRGASGAGGSGGTGELDAGRSSQPACLRGATQPCDCPGGGQGYASCQDGSGFGECDCRNPIGVGTADASRPSSGLDNCEPGKYVGTFSCMYTSASLGAPILVEGPVQFDLSIDETTASNDACDAEFCPDLTISEGSGELFGFANLIIGFQCTLEGGLDCTTGEFRAQAVGGEYGFPTPSDPNDPMSPATVAQPPWGTFDGSLDGTHNGQEPQEIGGDWVLTEMLQGGSCVGPFTVERQP